MMRKEERMTWEKAELKRVNFLSLSNKKILRKIDLRIV